MQYLDINKVWWNERVPLHVASNFYDHEAFINGKTSLKHIELALLPNVKNKTLLHLQCHFGQDTLSWEKLGAFATGIDFSVTAIKQAKETAKQLGLDAVFICSDVYALPAIHEYEYDIVFTSYGTISWLPDIQKWANVVAHFLKPGGTFVMVDFHPYISMYDAGFENIIYSYFNEGEIVEDEEGSYADTNEKASTKNITFNHSLANILQALINAGLQIELFSEYDYSTYDCFKNLKQLATDKFVVEHFTHKVPMMYSIKATKN